ncbi:PREDICTED: Fanconi anemia group D2 protein homolog isoform X2 [Ipomoea nil]|uniref:Fanconi anemia group D2 protein homolog isoform X2 n=1 Tax=Ipomoea nil TaxID=35883 RepID=UPI000900A985|nr:PREDICTED: Fanconi anemia group D2 protein homolog isoform X2 [Ipomoea nil]
MVLRESNQLSSRKRPSKPNNAFVPPFAHPPKIPKTTAAAAVSQSAPPHQSQSTTPVDKMVAVLADAGCTLINPTGPPCLPSDLPKLRHRLHHLFSSDSTLRSEFLHGLCSYINSPNNLRRMLSHSNRDGLVSVRSESVVRVLLLVPSIQSDIQNMLLEKLPEYFDMDPSGTLPSPRFEDDIARLILNQFRWLDFLVDSEAFIDRLLQVLSICPLHLKREMIGSLPEIIGDQNNKVVVDSLQHMLEEDPSVIIPVLDCFSNLHLDETSKEQVVTIGLSCIRTADMEHMPYLLRFLLLSATISNTRRIISHIREQLKFVGGFSYHATQQGKMKGKSIVKDGEASVLDALRSSLQFNKIICEEVLKELKSLEKARDHKTIDIWLLVLIYKNGESLQKSIEKLLKKKIVEGYIDEALFDQCVNGNKAIAQDYLPTFISISGYLLACKEQKAQEFGIHMYKCLFEEFADSFSRQELLGALITHVGSGINHEVRSGLQAMVLLASKYSLELIPLSSHIMGILDYLEGFSFENLHQVYEAFSVLALSARSNAGSRSSISNELLMIVRKQLSNPDLKYKKMGLIGTVKIVYYFGAEVINSSQSSSQKSNVEEALELLKTSLESCKQMTLPLIMFYDELVVTLKNRSLHPSITEWISKHIGDFESKYLSDLDGGQLPVKDVYCGLEGQLWMNLDGDISPICVNLLPLVSSSLRSAPSLEILPAKISLLSTIEKLTNQGSLLGIDALLGCPLHLPSSKLFSISVWQSLNGNQKQIIILSLYYAANWIRELLNAFCSQVTNKCDYVSQGTKEEIALKLFKRLRNLIFLESMLNNCLRQYPLSLPELCPLEPPSQNLLNQTREHERSNELTKRDISSSESTRKKKKKNPALSASSKEEGKLRQQTITDVLRKAGVMPSPEVLTEDLSGMCSKGSIPESSGNHQNNLISPLNVEISSAAKFLEPQRHKFRPLLLECFPIFALSKNQDSCCRDPAAELPLHLYLLRDLSQKLDYCSPQQKQILAKRANLPPSLGCMNVMDFLNHVRLLFPSLKKNLDHVLHILREDTEICQDHWEVQSAAAGNPDITGILCSTSKVSYSVLKETLCCFSKMVNIPEIQRETAVLTDLLEAFQPTKIPDSFFLGMRHIPSPGNIDYLYSGAYYYLEELFSIASTISFTLSSEVVLTLEAVILSIRKIVDKDSVETGNIIQKGFIKELFSFLCEKLGTSAKTLLTQKYDSENVEEDSKIRRELVQKILRIYLENCQSTSASLNELACSILPQATSKSKTSQVEDKCSFPSLCPATFIAWYRVMHEQNVATLNKLVKEVCQLEKSKARDNVEGVDCLLNRLEQSVNVVVSLVSMCKTHDKVAVRAMAVKFSGKFVDSFLRVFGFLQAQFQLHGEQIVNLVLELQKATRTIQAICSEAKGLKQTTITSKIPSTKRSMERFLFHVKALLHSTSSGCTFWMGNLKHKNLVGDIVSSQAYKEEEEEDVDDKEDDPEAAENTEEDQAVDGGNEE